MIVIGLVTVTVIVIRRMSRIDAELGQVAHGFEVVLAGPTYKLM